MFSSKQTESFPGRTFYKRTGVNWPRFIPWLILPFIAAALLSIGMFALVSVGEYYVIILPVIAAAMVGGLMVLAVIRDIVVILWWQESSAALPGSCCISTIFTWE